MLKESICKCKIDFWWAFYSKFLQLYCEIWLYWWRKKVPWEYVNQIQEVCGQVLETMGYPVFTNESAYKSWHI